MGLQEQSVVIESVPWRDVAEVLSKTRPFAETPDDAVRGVEVVDRVTAKAESVLRKPGEAQLFYWVVARG